MKKVDTKLEDIVAISAVRTPLGRFGGTLKDTLSYILGSYAIRAAWHRAGISPADVDDVIYGSCRQAGNGPNPARTAALFGGLSVETPAITLNMACPSGMKSLMYAAQGILTGQGEVYMTGGMDSMSTIPYLLKGARFEGFKMGNRVIEDGWSDSVDPVYDVGMGQTAEEIADKYDISREHQDEFALESHQKAVAAMTRGDFEDEIIPLDIKAGKKQKALILTKDECPRSGTSLEKLSSLKPVFKKNGTVTAGNACAMADGAAAIVLTSRARAKALGAQPLFSIVTFAQDACKGITMGEGPGFVIPKALKNVGLTLDNMDLYEVNEAFAAQILANERMLNWDRSKLNVNGGAIALGHPTGISGARTIVTLYHALKQRDKELGIASICGSGGVSTAMVIKREQ